MHLLPQVINVLQQLTMEQVLDFIERHRVRRAVGATVPNSSWICHFKITLAPGPLFEDNCFLNRPERWQRLPSSLEQKSPIWTELRHSGPKTAASVSYTLHARLHRGDALLASHVQKINIFDCSEIAPPLDIEDFTPEYNVCQESLLRKYIFQKLGRMAIGAKQPPALIFSKPGELAATKVLLNVTLHTIQEHFAGCAQDVLEASINWRLQSSTFVCMHMPNAIPTIRQVTTSPSMGHIVKASSTHHLKMRWSNWVRKNPAGSEYTEWTASYPVLLPVESTSTLPPTFFLPYLSRRYSILLEISISGPCRSRATLKLPVQIVYQSVGTLSLSTGELSQSSASAYVVAGISPLRNHDRQELPSYLV